jgi:transcription antitermination factor NusB
MLALYQADILGSEFTSDAREWLSSIGRDKEMRSFATELFDNTIRHLPEIDSLIAKAAQNWQLKRMAAIDRALLRMAVNELLYHSEVPPKVVINEALELAKRYSTAASGSFVNGILDRIHKDRAGGD